MKISDHTATTTCALFNEVSQNFLGNKSVDTMLEQEGYSETIPESIQNLCGRTLIFRLKLNSRNLEECMENYKVNCTFEPDNELEMNYSNEKAEEVCTYTFFFLPKDIQNHNGKCFAGHARLPRTWRLNCFNYA